MRRPQKQSVTKEQLSIRSGDPVIYRNDLGENIGSVATSESWQLGHGDWVIKLEGVSGGYDLSRVRLRK